ncbi:hypothetical protein [Marilutibacter aestuarii]|uniref:Uncharacterized protein n=1 Tax=Marilutibacter aestuarii TaxID=1706195 RepID=A0A508AIZ3_9GAMM|nr:hypothetical protein [Lysobacter aestuarii]TQD49779.1 hypothetical protein FKV25_03845 [Lysobacter aestuarii]
MNTTPIPFAQPAPSPCPVRRICAALALVALLVAQLGAFQVSAQTRAAPTRQVLALPSDSKGATCTSTDGKATCSCSAPGGKCQAKATSCSCYGVPPPPAQPAGQRGPGGLSATGAALKATCTSGNGLKVCACGDKGCNAAEVSCGCLDH